VKHATVCIGERWISYNGAADHEVETNNLDRLAKAVAPSASLPPAENPNRL
jgi:hypothetical protein